MCYFKQIKKYDNTLILYGRFWNFKNLHTTIYILFLFNSRKWTKTKCKRLSNRLLNLEHLITSLSNHLLSISMTKLVVALTDKYSKVPISGQVSWSLLKLFQHQILKKTHKNSMNRLRMKSKSWSPLKTKTLLNFMMSKNLLTTFIFSKNSAIEDRFKISCKKEKNYLKMKR